MNPHEVKNAVREVLKEWSVQNTVTPDGKRILYVDTSSSSGAGALESTQLMVLNAIQNEKDFSTQLVTDTGNSDQVVMLITTKNEDTGAITQTYLDASGAVYVPVGPLEFIVGTSYTT